MDLLLILCENLEGGGERLPANWVYLGQTKGRGKLGPAGKQSVPIKDLWVFPLVRIPVKLNTDSGS